MSKNSFRLCGSVVPLITPLDSDECVDAKSLRKVICFQEEKGTDALFLLGSCGEGSCLTDAAREVVLDTALSMGTDLPILVGVAEAATRRAVDWAKRAAKPGISALVVMMPIFHWLKNPQEMIDHFEAIYDATGKPIIVYNFPVKTDGAAVPIDVLSTLCERKVIIGIKDSSGDLSYLKRLIEIRDDFEDLGVMNGELRTACAALRLGVDGLVMSYSNVEPDKCKELIATVREGKMDQAEALQQRFIQAWNEFEPTVNPVMKVKSILSYWGLCKPICCAPIRQIKPFVPRTIQEA